MGTITNQAETVSGSDEKKKTGIPFKLYQELKSAVHRDLLNKVDLERIASMRDGRIRGQVFVVIQELVSGLGTPMSAPEREQLAREVLDEVFGLGPLEPLLQDPTLNDILVNTHKQVYVERQGMLEETAVKFKDDAHLMHIIDKIVAAVGRRVDESSPMVDARLADGSRVNHHPAPGDRWTHTVNPALRPCAPDGGRSDSKPNPDTAHAGDSQGGGEGTAQHGHLRGDRRR